MKRASLWTRINHNQFSDTDVVSDRTKKLLVKNGIYTIRDWEIKHNIGRGEGLVEFKGLGSKSKEEIYFYIHLLLTGQEIN